MMFVASRSPSPTMEAASEEHGTVTEIETDSDSSDDLVNGSDDESVDWSSSEDSDSTYSSDFDSDDGEEIAALEKKLFNNISHPLPKQPTCNTNGNSAIIASSALRHFFRNSMSESCVIELPNISIMPDPMNELMRRASACDLSGSKHCSPVTMCIQTALPTQTFVDKTKSEHPLSRMSPTETLKTILTSRGRSTDTIASKQVKDFFVHSAEHITAYDMQVMSLVRSNDLDGLRKLHASGKELQCCNRFYESVLHTVARRGHADIMDFLLNVAQLDLRVCCASGRTPLHDACWTTSPNFDCIQMILQRCPDFLLIADNRNFLPLSYVPQDCWGEWNDFLNTNAEIVAGDCG